MDRGWHQASYSGQDRSRSGQQSYNRDRGVSNDRRGFYDCGQNGHSSRNCLKLERHYDSGRFVERYLAGGGNVRWSHDSWSSSRIALGKEHRYSRTEIIREASSRRLHPVYYESCNHRLRDGGDRPRTLDDRGPKVATVPYAGERDVISSRSSFCKPVNEDYQAAGVHEGEEWRASRGKERDIIPRQSTANGKDRHPSDYVVPGGEDRRSERTVQEGRATSKPSSSEAELVTVDSLGGGGSLGCSSRDRHVSQHIVGSPERWREANNEVNCQLSDNDGERDMNARVDNAMQSIVSDMVLSRAELPFSVFCKGAADGKFERMSRVEKSVVCSGSSSSFVESMLPLSPEKMDIDSVSHLKTNLGNPSVAQGDTYISLSITREVVNSSHSEQETETTGKPSREERILTKSSERMDTHGLPGFGDSQPKSRNGLKNSRPDRRRSKDRAKEFDQDENVFCTVEESLSDAALEFESLTLPSDITLKNQLADLEFVEKVDSGPVEDASEVEGGWVSQYSEDDTSGLILLSDRENETEEPPRGLELTSLVEEVDPDCYGRHDGPDQHRVGFDEVTDKNIIRHCFEDIHSSDLETPMRERSCKRRNVTHLGCVRDGSVDKISGTNSYARCHERTGYSCRHGDYEGGYTDMAGGSSWLSLDFHSGEDSLGCRQWGSDWRHSRHWKAHPGHSQYYPGSYVSVCNARYLQHRRCSRKDLSSQSSELLVPLDPFLSSSQIEEGNSILTEAQSRGWRFQGLKGNLQGPKDLAELKAVAGSRQLQPDYTVQHEGNNEWVLLDYACSPLKSNFVPSSLHGKETCGTGSAKAFLISSQMCDRPDPELFEEEQSNLENTDQDICPPGTEASASGNIDYNLIDFHIDERVEKLMDGITLVPGKEKEIVHEALSSAAHRVQQEYESDIAIEDSSQCHGVLADLSAHWKDADLASDIQSFRFDQQAVKVYTKLDEAGVERSDSGNTEVVSAPESTSAECCYPDSKQVFWRWPSRGGDWRLLYILDKSQQMRGEAQGSVEKGHTGNPRKLVMNEGRPLCVGENSILHDPRKEHQMSGRNADVLCSIRLEVPNFARKAALLKVESSFQDHVHYNQPCLTVSRVTAAMTPKSQSYISLVHLSNSMKGHSASDGFGGVSKIDKFDKSNTTQGLLTVTGAKLMGKGKQQCLEASNLICNGELYAARSNSAVVERCGPPPLASGLIDSQVKPGFELDVRIKNWKTKQSMPDGSLHNLPIQIVQQKASELVLFKCANETSFKKLLYKRILASKECLSLNKGLWYYLDGAGHEVGPSGIAHLQSLAVSGELVEGSSIYRKADDTWVPLTDYLLQDSTGTCGEVFVSLRNTVSHISKGCGSGDRVGIFPGASSFHESHPQYLGFTRGKLHEYVMKSYKAVFSAALNEGLEKWFQSKQQEILSVVTASMTPVCSPSSIPVLHAPYVAASTMMDLQLTEKFQIDVLPGDESSHQRQVHDHSPLPDTISMDGESCLLKRKSWSSEDDQASKQHSKSLQRRRLLDFEESEVGRQAFYSSHVACPINPSLPFLVNDHSREASEVAPSEPLEKSGRRVEELNWSKLRPSILRAVFRSLRGDVKTLVTAMATCKSWLAVGKKYKTELKRVDLSSVQGRSLDAVLECLPGFGGGKLRRIILKGCPVSPESLEHLLQTCPSISAVEIGYGEPLRKLIRSFPKVRWLRDRNGVQRHKECLIHRQEDLYLKTKSSQVSHWSGDGLRRVCDESEMHLVSDGVKISEECTCLRSADVETLINVSVEDSDITHLTCGRSNGMKHLKMNSGGFVVKSNGMYGTSKTLKQENGNSIIPPLLKEKVLPGCSYKKYEKGAYRRSKPVTGGQLVLPDRHSSSNVKVEHLSRSLTSCVFEGDKSLEKEMALVLRLLMEADTDKCFQSANLLGDAKGLTSVSGRPLDLSMIDKKLKGGAYAGGKDGLKAFKEDVNLLTRNGFRNEKDRTTFSTAEKIFKLAHHHFVSLESQIAGASPADLQHQGKLPGPRLCSKVGKGRVKNIPMFQQCSGNKRKEWDDDGPKGNCGVLKKGGLGDSSSDDLDSNSDSEHELRRFSRLKKEHRWEYECDSSEDDDEAGFMEEDEETETEVSDSDESEGEDGSLEDDNYDAQGEQLEVHEWGARMTKAAMVPPVTRKYVIIEEYRIVADKERVEQKMHVNLPQDYEDKIVSAKEKRIDSYSHLDIPELRDYRPRKKLGEEVLEQEVYGIDPYTHNLLLDTMPDEVSGFSETQKQQFIEEKLLLALNKDARQYTGSGRAPMEYSLETVVDRISAEADISKDWALHDFCGQLLNNMRSRPKDKFVAYRKGLGVVCNKTNGLEKDEFVVEFFGEVYPPWRWYEKQDGIRSLQKKDKDTTPEFYNIFYERPKGDAAGYDLLVVDAMHKANFASRLCHSCRPNCEAKITAVNNTYIIGVYTLKPIKRGEELTFDYNSVTESKEEYNNAVCLCGSQGCRGSYLNLTGSGTFEEVIMKHHGVLDRHCLLLDSCSTASVTNEEWQEMRQAGLGSCLLSGLPAWVLKYAANLVHFMNFEKIHLPAELLKDFDLKRQTGMIEGCTEVDAEITTEGVYNQRLQNLAITLDKVRHILTKLYRDPSLAPPPLRRLDQKDLVEWIWKRDDSVVSELLQCLGLHLPKDVLLDLKQGISKHAPHDSGTDLRQCLLWLRDELRTLPATCKARHDAAADVIHFYAYTRYFFTLEDYAVLESTPMNIHPLDLGSNRHGSSSERLWHKTYSKEYVWGQLINWYKQNVADPGASLVKASRGCLILPDVSSCYAKSMQHDFRQGYGQKHREEMIFHIEERPQQHWPKSKFWSKFWCFKNERGLLGSPMLDSVMEGRPLNEQMVEWLRIRKDVFVGPWDEQ